MWDFQQRGGEFRRSGFGHTGQQFEEEPILLQFREKSDISGEKKLWWKKLYKLASKTKVSLGQE